MEAFERVYIIATTFKTQKTSVIHTIPSQPKIKRTSAFVKKKVFLFLYYNIHMLKKVF
jgi:hypothetical protein